MNSREIESIIDSLEADDRSLSDEREFVENLFVGRFNYFLIVFSLFVTAGFANSFKTFKSAVFYAGALVLLLVWLSLYRGYKKHDRILRIIFQRKADHPANKIETLMRLEGYEPRYEVSRLMGVVIPWVCILLLIMAGVATTLSYLQ
jgi:amino acid permease